MEQVKKEKNKELFFQIFWYFTIFSVIGLAIETLYCYLTTGVLESRKGLLWGPFCPVYGVGATIIICLLDKYRENGWKLFFYGIILGGVIEYILSYILEAIYGIRFWEYSYLVNNLNGRICITYSIFWGILSIFLIKGVKPKIDILLEKIPYKNRITKLLFVFFIINVFVTIWGINTYESRVRKGPNNIEKQNSIINKIEDNYFTNERMMKNFPNLRIITQEGEEVFIRELI